MSAKERSRAFVILVGVKLPHQNAWRKSLRKKTRKQKRTRPKVKKKMRHNNNNRTRIPTCHLAYFLEEKYLIRAIVLHQIIDKYKLECLCSERPHHNIRAGSVKVRASNESSYCKRNLCDRVCLPGKFLIRWLDNILNSIAIKESPHSRFNVHATSSKRCGRCMAVETTLLQH